jgi:Fe-S cluster assembly scaffold protein SufB
MLEITKNWFYKISELNLESKEIIIWNNLQIAFYDDSLLKSKLKVIIWKNSSLEYFSFFSEEWLFNRHFILKDEKSSVAVKSLIFSENNKIESTITWELAENNSEINLDILSFAWENWEIKLDWILQINEELKWVKWRLDEENIFLWDSWKISGIPTLLVSTNDVEASHSCKMEKISDDKLFYLRSRWVEKENALKIMIEAKIKNLYRCLEIYNKEFYDEVIETILNKIK